MLSKRDSKSHSEKYSKALKKLEVLTLKNPPTTSTLKYYTTILESIKIPSLAKKCAVDIPRYLKYFLPCFNVALDKFLDLCEDDVIEVRIEAIKGLWLFCNDEATFKYHPKISDILCQLLQTDIKQEQETVEDCLLKLLKGNAPVTITAIFHQMAYGSPAIKKECLNFFNKFVITSKLKDETLLHVGSEFKKIMTNAAIPNAEYEVYLAIFLEKLVPLTDSEVLSQIILDVYLYRMFVFDPIENYIQQPDIVISKLVALLKLCLPYYKKGISTPGFFNFISTSILITAHHSFTTNQKYTILKIWTDVYTHSRLTVVDPTMLYEVFKKFVNIGVEVNIDFSSLECILHVLYQQHEKMLHNEFESDFVQRLKIVCTSSFNYMNGLKIVEGKAKLVSYNVWLLSKAILYARGVVIPDTGVIKDRYALTWKAATSFRIVAGDMPLIIDALIGRTNGIKRKESSFSKKLSISEPIAKKRIIDLPPKQVSDNPSPLPIDNEEHRMDKINSAEISKTLASIAPPASKIKKGYVTAKNDPAKLPNKCISSIKNDPIKQVVPPIDNEPKVVFISNNNTVKLKQNIKSPKLIVNNKNGYLMANYDHSTKSSSPEVDMKEKIVSPKLIVNNKNGYFTANYDPPTKSSSPNGDIREKIVSPKIIISSKNEYFIANYDPTKEINQSALSSVQNNTANMIVTVKNDVKEAPTTTPPRVIINNDSASNSTEDLSSPSSKRLVFTAKNEKQRCIITPPKMIIEPSVSELNLAKNTSLSSSLSVENNKVLFSKHAPIMIIDNDAVKSSLAKPTHSRSSSSSSVRTISNEIHSPMEMSPTRKVINPQRKIVDGTITLPLSLPPARIVMDYQMEESRVEPEVKFVIKKKKQKIEPAIGPVVRMKGINSNPKIVRPKEMHLAFSSIPQQKFFDIPSSQQISISNDTPESRFWQIPPSQYSLGQTPIVHDHLQGLKRKINTPTAKIHINNIVPATAQPAVQNHLHGLKQHIIHNPTVRKLPSSSLPLKIIHTPVVIPKSSSSSSLPPKILQVGMTKQPPTIPTPPLSSNPAETSTKVSAMPKKELAVEKKERKVRSLFGVCISDLKK